MRLGDLYQLGHRLQSIAETAMSGGRAFDLSPAEVIVIGDLIEHDGSTISEIARRTGFVHSRVSTAVGSLRERGWAETSADQADRRRTRVAVTDQIRKGGIHSRDQDAAPLLGELFGDLAPGRRDELTAAIGELHRILVTRQAGEGPRPASADGRITPPAFRP
jgi:DNA-binding MarR family transcriptional regulator